MKRLRAALLLLFVAGTSAAMDGSADGSSSPDVRSSRNPALDAPVRPTPANNLEHAIHQLEREEQALKKRLGETDRESALVHARSVVRGRAYVRLVRAGLLPIGGGFDALVDHATRLERLYRGLSADVQRERHLIIERRKIAEKLELLRARRAPLEVEQRLVAEAQAAVLAAEERRLAFESAFDASADGAHAAVYGASMGPSDPHDTAEGFAALKGRLPFPITGRSEVRSSRRAGSDGPGVEMRAPVGTPVRAVFPGRIAFADTYSDYGRTVIIDHGSRYYTVSANLGGVDVKVGDEVSSGERIGTVGNGPSGTLLYFEVRAGQDTVDPAEWFGL